MTRRKTKNLLKYWPAPHRDQVSNSPIFYEQLFCKKVFCAAFIYLQFDFVIVWQKSISTKDARKMLVKLTPKAADRGGAGQGRPGQSVGLIEA